MTYASLSQVKAALRLTDSVDDSMLTLALSSADEAINAYCGRTFGTAAADSTRTYAAGKPDAVEVDDGVDRPVFLLDLRGPRLYEILSLWLGSEQRHRHKLRPQQRRVFITVEQRFEFGRLRCSLGAAAQRRLARGLEPINGLVTLR